MSLLQPGSVLSLAFALLATGCTVQTSSAPPPRGIDDGTLALDWSISGSKDPSVCSQSGAAAIDIKVYEAAGGFVGEYQQACSAFATSIQLPAGSYTADAVLIDGAGRPRTTTINVNPFTIHGSDQLDIPVDFPPGSFN
jgi:hypothetical protein